MPAVKPASTTRRLKERHNQSPDRAHGVKRHSLLFGLLLFCSGLAALVYQVLWIRQLTLVVGVEVYSITIAVSAFFAGLAVGGAVLGRLADRWTHPLRLYVLLESGVAVTAVTSTILLAHAAGLFVALESRAGSIAWALPFALVGAPAFLMGGTLPVALRWLTQLRADVAESGGWVYAANTAGGIAGTLLSAFALLPWLGVRGTAWVAAAFNVAAACMALALDRRASSGSERTVSNSSSVGSRTALALYAASGGIALG